MNQPTIASLPSFFADEFLLQHLQNINLKQAGNSKSGIPDHEFDSNKLFWRGFQTEQYKPLQWVNLKNFQLIDWFPRTPGLYYTAGAQQARSEAQEYVREENGVRFYNPSGKERMILGGIGAVRFKPITIEGVECWLCTATSDGYCHSGVPLAIPNHLLRSIGFQFNRRYTLTGEVRFLPEFLERYFKHMIRIPQIYVLIDRITPVASLASDVPIGITPMVFFKRRTMEHFSEKGNVTFVNCRSDAPSEFDRAADWITQYVHKYEGEILTNFDQQRPTFEDALFSLQNLMSGNVDQSWVFQTVNISNAQIISEKIEQINAEIIHTPKVEARLGSGTTIIEKHFSRNPWISGSFYLAAAVIITTLFLVMARTVDIVVLPIVIVGSLLAVSIVGAFQLRQDQGLSEENFLSLMLLVFRQLPFLRKGKRDENSDQR